MDTHHTRVFLSHLNKKFVSQTYINLYTPYHTYYMAMIYIPWFLLCTCVLFSVRLFVDVHARNTPPSCMMVITRNIEGRVLEPSNQLFKLESG